MSMKLCKECGKEVSKSAKVCPNCGNKLKPSALKVILIIILFFIVMGIIAGATGDTSKTSNTSSNQTVKTVQNKVDLNKFNKIKTNMTYKEVVKIIGEEGTLSTESSYGNQSMKIYYWYAENGISNATISFTNGKVSAKSQIGLK